MTVEHVPQGKPSAVLHITIQYTQILQFPLHLVLIAHKPITVQKVVFIILFCVLTALEKIPTVYWFGTLFNVFHNKSYFLKQSLFCNLSKKNK